MAQSKVQKHTEKETSGKANGNKEGSPRAPRQIKETQSVQNQTSVVRTTVPVLAKPSMTPDEQEHVAQMVEQLYQRLDSLELKKAALVETQKEMKQKSGKEHKKKKTARALEVVKARVSELEEAIEELVDVLQRIVAIISPKNVVKDIIES